MGLIRFAAKMGTLFAGVGFVAGCGWIGEQLLKEALGSQDVSMGLGMGAGAVVLGLIVTPIAVALKQDDGIEDGRAVQLGLHNFSAHFGILGGLIAGLMFAGLAKAGLISPSLEPDAGGTVPRILPIRFWKWLLMTIGSVFLVCIAGSIVYAVATGAPIGKN